MKTLQRAALVLVALLSSACGDTMSTYYKTVSTTALAASTCRDVLSVAHEKKTAAVTELAKTDKASAQVRLDEWMPVYEKVKLACASLKSGASLALAAAPVVERAVSQKKDAMGWIALLVKTVILATAELEHAGLKLTEVK